MCVEVVARRRGRFWLDQLRDDSVRSIGDLWRRAVDTVVKRRDGHRQLRDYDDDDDD